MNNANITTGTVIYYTGDAANVSGWFVVSAIRADGSVDMVERDGERTILAIHHVANVYRGHCGDRFVTKAAYDAYRAAAMASLLIEAMQRATRLPQ